MTQISEMQPKFTAGEWKNIEWELHAPTTIVNPSRLSGLKETIAEVSLGSSEWEANASAIADLPKFYEALRELLAAEKELYTHDKSEEETNMKYRRYESAKATALELLKKHSK